MKTYQKAQVIAKNNPQGSYAAGCPPQNAGTTNADKCKKCETSK
jgi:hypothetical protein